MAVTPRFIQQLIMRFVERNLAMLWRNRSQVLKSVIGLAAGLFLASMSLKYLSPSVAKGSLRSKRMKGQPGYVSHTLHHHATEKVPPANVWSDTNIHTPLKRELYQGQTGEPIMHFRNLFNQTYFSSSDTIGTDNITGSAKYLIYRCDMKALARCGGWADRIRGIMAGYIIANLTGRIFKSEILLRSCDIHQFIIPNRVNWSLPVSFHDVVQKNPNDSRIVIQNYSNRRKFWSQVNNTDFSTIFDMKSTFVYYKSNLDYMDGFKTSKYHHKPISWMQKLSRDQINAAIFKRLFKLSPHLHDKLNAFLDGNLTPKDKLICIHVRTGNNPSMPDATTRVKLSYLPNIWNFLRNASKGDFQKIFIMSDSDRVIDEAKQQSFGCKVFSSPGKIVHIAFSLKQNLTAIEECNGLEKVIMEQFLLMHCDTLVISKSGLSRMAAYVRGSDQGLYCILGQGHVVPCQKSKIQELYHIMG